MIPRGPIIDPAVLEQFAWTLLHSLWEGLAAAIALAISFSFLRKHSANLRYGVACAALLVAVAAPAVTFFHLAGRFDDPGPLLIPSALLGDEIPTPPTGWRDSAITFIRPALPWLALAWLIGAIVSGCYHILGWILLRRALSAECAPMSPDRERLRALVKRFDVRRPITFLETCINSPAMTGWIRPVILLPAAATSGLTYDQLSLAVCHELAHIRRHDYVVALVQSAVMSILFFNPAVRWISRQIDIERENCCDDLVDQITGKRREYARALYAIAAGDRETARLTLAVAGGALLDRITRMTLDRHLRHRRRPALGPVVAAGILALLCSNTFLHGSLLRPARSLADVRSLSGHVYDVIAVQPGAGDFPQALDHCVTAIRDDKMTDDDLNRLVKEILSDGRPDVLAENVLAQHDWARHADKRNRPVPYGTHRQRQQIAQALRQHVHEYPQSLNVTSFARATILLSAQDSSLFGAGPLAAVLRDPVLIRSASLTQRQVSRLQRHLADHWEVSRHATELQARADALLAKTRKGSPPAELSPTLEALAELAPNRRDIQCQLAAIYARGQQLFGATDPSMLALKDVLSEKVRDPTFDKVLADSYGACFSRATETMTEDDLRGRIRKIRPATPASESVP